MAKQSDLPKEQPSVTANTLQEKQKAENKQFVSLPPRISRRDDPENWGKMFDQ